jgi:hypothetical protein
MKSSLDRTWAMWAAVTMGTGFGCNGGHVSAPLVAHERITHAPPAARMAVVPLVAAPGAHAAPPTYASPVANASVDARILVITANGTDAAFAAIQSTLQYLGTPFDVLNATTGATLTAGTLSDGSHGHYQAVFLDLGDLSVNGTSAFSDAEWTTLATYEASFGVRRVSLYTSPTADYGLIDYGSVDPSMTPINATCTAAGRSVFVGANCANPVNINAGFAYPASPIDAATIPLLVDAAGNVYAATRTYSDGREALALTFAQASYFVSYLELAYGLVDWATHGLFIGERHAYAVPQIDDLFLSSDIYTGGIYRITGADLQAFANWENATQNQPLTAGFRFAWACNGQGSQSMPGDPLTAKVVALGSTFSWLNHTWDHPELDGLSYAQVLEEFTRNDQYLRGLGLAPYATVNAVTPNISGLSSADAMLAIRDAGIAQIASDTSVAGQNNPAPNAGIPNALQPTVLEIPRIPSELYYNVSQPSEWIPEYEAIRSPTAAVDYGTIIGTQSDAFLQYLLNGNNDPWMFHQANTRDYDGAGHSLLTDLMDATIAKYSAVATLPIVSPLMDDLAGRVRNRMALNASGVVATVQAGTSMTVSVGNAATVPVTGLCTPGAETYAGQTISYLSLTPGQPATLSLTSCNPGGAGGVGGAAGAGGMPGGGGGGGGGGSGTTGVGGVTGAAGTGGSSGLAGTAGAAGAAGTSGSGVDGGIGGGTGVAAGAGGISGAAGAAGEGQGGTGESETGAGGAIVSTGGMPGSGGAGPSPSGDAGASPSDAGVTPPPQPPTGCSCDFGSNRPGPGAFLFSLLGGGLAIRSRRGRKGGRKSMGSSAQPPRGLPGSC